MIPKLPSPHILATSLLSTLAISSTASATPFRSLIASVAFSAAKVTNCNESGPDSLRAALAGALDQDVIDLTNLSCSTVTLSSGALVDTSTPANVTIRGNNFVIDADQRDRALVHAGTGYLVLEGITVKNGFYHGSFGGGCIYSAGSVRLTDTTVTGCTLDVVNSKASGGGIYAKDAALLYSSVVSFNTAISHGGTANGGGVYASAVHIASAFSIGQRRGVVITANSAQSDLPAPSTFGGGVSTRLSADSGNFFAYASEVSGNSAYIGSAIDSATANIRHTTISGNSGGVAIYSANGQVILDACTVAQNFSPSHPKGAGLAAATGVIAGTILGPNFYPDGAPNNDLVSESPASAFAFESSLIVNSNLLLPSSNVLRENPMLGPLQLNGGNTRTHALLPGSPAIDRGKSFLSFDQRGNPYKRLDGAAPDIGAFETSDRLFYDGMDY